MAKPARLGTYLRHWALLLGAAVAPLADAGEPSIGPEQFFQPARMTGASISPDGRTVVLTTAASKTGRVRLVALDLSTMKFTALAGYEDVDIASFHWVNDHRVGDPVADAAQLRDTSPVNNVARIHAPVLMAYGGKDVRVPKEHGEHFHDALSKVPGAKVEWVFYDDEGHGWRSLDTNIDFWNRVVKFLDANIGAR